MGQLALAVGMGNRTGMGQVPGRRSRERGGGNWLFEGGQPFGNSCGRRHYGLHDVAEIKGGARQGTGAQASGTEVDRTVKGEGAEK